MLMESRGRYVKLRTPNGVEQESVVHEASDGKKSRTATRDQKTMDNKITVAASKWEFHPMR